MVRSSASKNKKRNSNKTLSKWNFRPASKKSEAQQKKSRLVIDKPWVCYVRWTVFIAKCNIRVMSVWILLSITTQCEAIYTTKFERAREKEEKNLLTIRFPFFFGALDEKCQHIFGTITCVCMCLSSYESVVLYVGWRSILFIVIHVESQSQTLDSSQIHWVYFFFVFSLSPLSFCTRSYRIDSANGKIHAQQTPNDTIPTNYSTNSILISVDADNIYQKHSRIRQDKIK